MINHARLTARLKRVRTNVRGNDSRRQLGGINRGIRQTQCSGTRTKEVVAALRKLGVNCGDPPLTRLPNPWRWDDLPKTCIVKMHFEWTKITHWAVWHNNRFYDPSESGHQSLYEVIGYPPGVRITSYLPIFMSREADGHE